MNESKMQKFKKSFINTIITMVTTAVLITIIYYFMNGMFLIGIPEPKEVSKVIIQNMQKTDDSKEFIDDRNIELACNLANFLNYEFKKVDDAGEAVIAITYEKMDGSIIKLSANENTVWWKGKAHPLKKKEIFLNLTKGIFSIGE